MRESIRVFVFGLVCILCSCVRDGVDGAAPASQTGLSRVDVRLDVDLASCDVTRAEDGDAVREVNDLNILFYNADGELIRAEYFTADEISISEMPTSDLPQYGDDVPKAESTTQHLTGIMIDEVPYGNYRIYAVANMGDLSADERISTESSLRRIQLVWNLLDVAANNAMFGHFDLASASTISVEAPIVSIAAMEVSLRAYLRRAVSKLTIDYDGSQLNENVTIYIHRAQVRDIASTCLLGYPNTPTSLDELIAEGDTLLYTTTDAPTSGLMIARGNASGGSLHGERERALYFFENMQGSGPKHQYDATGTILKDEKPYGTYVEVIGYYINLSAEGATHGPIRYRFMMGKNVTDNFDAERNNHYKLTLRFRGDANNPDWHIEYEDPMPEISIPSRIYISYGYNEQVNLPVVVRDYDSSVSLRATIVDNNWSIPDHPYAHVGQENYNGFLSLARTNAYIVGNYDPSSGSGADVLAARQRDFAAGETASYQPDSVSRGRGYYSVPLYTRGILLGNSFSGSNSSVHSSRTAIVRVTATVGGRTLEQDVEVVQVKRVVNPAGVWRSGSSVAPFRVQLMELNDSDVGSQGALHRDFYAPRSDGPWCARVVKGEDWVRIKAIDSDEWSTKQVVGPTGSIIEFDYRPADTYADGVRCGVIEVLYHDYNCVHYIFVSQGVGAVDMAGTRWQNRNLLFRGKLVANPLLEGSMFKYGNFDLAIRAENNVKTGYGFDIDCSSRLFDAWSYDTSSSSITQRQSYFSQVGVRSSGYPAVEAEGGLPATAEQWQTLEPLRRYYGVMYGDECSQTMTTTTDAYTYLSEGDRKGMQGIFLWDDGRGANHIFLPIGATGYGHRKRLDDTWYWNDGSGRIAQRAVLKYAVRCMVMPSSAATLMPMYYDLWIQRGAIYWYRRRAVSTEQYSHDVNYFTFGFESFAKNGLDFSDGVIVDSDLAFVRCVE